jgi:hypothetical protein
MPIQMDASTRWETEAIRASASQRSNPPRPSAKRSSQGAATQRDVGDGSRWVTLKEAEAATGVPSNTVRKWVRKGTVDSYLESDGQLALRMVNLDSLLMRAKDLGRTVVERDTPDPNPEIEVAGETEPDLPEPPDDDRPPSPPTRPEDTMLVPVDAWNKMLNQLGNLHEAGQQLAEARERAAKAETESIFLRERLSEMRKDADAASRAEHAARVDQVIPNATDHLPLTTDSVSDVAPDIDSEPEVEVESPEGSGTASHSETTTYWRYLTTGWRDRKRRSRQ